MVHVPKVIELNLLLADWYDENHRQSLLNKANAKWAREMLYNTRWAASALSFARRSRATACSRMTESM